MKGRTLSFQRLRDAGRTVSAATAASTAMAVLLSLAGIFVSSPLSCGGAAFDEETLIKTFKEIHKNIYTIYKLREGEKIYDTLALSCSGAELEKQVFEYMKCLRIQDDLKTFITIVDVIYNDVRVLKQTGTEAEVYCKWFVIGKVRHPTHIHRKTNLNEALYYVSAGSEGPRIKGYDLLTNQAVEVTKR